MGKDFTKKRIYSFHLVFRDRYLATLRGTGEAIVASPFIRFLIYQVLDQEGTHHTTTFHSFGGALRSLDEIVHCTNCYAKMAMHFLSRGQFDGDRIVAAAEELDVYLEITGVTVKEVERLFDVEVTREEQFSILTRLFHDNYIRHWIPANIFRPYKLIKKIRISPHVAL